MEPSGGPRVAFVVVTKGLDYPTLEDRRPAGARYTRDAIRGMLQFMGCKPRHAFKATQLVFQKLERFAAEGSKFSYGSRQLWSVGAHEEGSVYVAMPRSEFYELVCSTLTEYNYKYAPSSDEIKAACSLRERRRHIIVLLCGTSGSGKSTLASILASRLGISTVLSTDSVRHMMRSFTTAAETPLLFASTYEAGEALRKQQALDEARHQQQHQHEGQGQGRGQGQQPETGGINQGGEQQDLLRPATAAEAIDAAAVAASPALPTQVHDHHTGALDVADVAPAGGTTTTAAAAIADTVSSASIAAAESPRAGVTGVAAASGGGGPSAASAFTQLSTAAAADSSSTTTTATGAITATVQTIVAGAASPGADGAPAAAGSSSNASRMVSANGSAAASSKIGPTGPTTSSSTTTNNNNSSSSNTTPIASAHDMAIRGYKAQCELVSEQLEQLICGFEARRQSLVVEGVHLHVGLVMRLLQRHPGVVPFLVYIKSEGKHVERMAVRAKYMTLDPNKNKYVKNMRNIRWIQDYLLRKAEKHAIPSVENTNIDRSVGLIHLTLLGCLKRMMKGEQVLDAGSCTVRMLHNEYSAVVDSLTGTTAAAAAATAQSSAAANVHAAAAPPPGPPSMFPPAGSLPGSGGCSAAAAFQRDSMGSWAQGPPPARVLGSPRIFHRDSAPPFASARSPVGGTEPEAPGRGDSSGPLGAHHFAVAAAGAGAGAAPPGAHCSSASQLEVELRSLGCEASAATAAAAAALLSSSPPHQQQVLAHGQSPQRPQQPAAGKQGKASRHNSFTHLHTFPHPEQLLLLPQPQPQPPDPLLQLLPSSPRPQQQPQAQTPPLAACDPHAHAQHLPAVSRSPARSAPRGGGGNTGCAVGGIAAGASPLSMHPHSRRSTNTGEGTSPPLPTRFEGRIEPGSPRCMGDDLLAAAGALMADCLLAMPLPATAAVGGLVSQQQQQQQQQHMAARGAARSPGGPPSAPLPSSGAADAGAWTAPCAAAAGSSARASPCRSAAMMSELLNAAAQQPEQRVSPQHRHDHHHHHNHHGHPETPSQQLHGQQHQHQHQHQEHQHEEHDQQQLHGQQLHGRATGQALSASPGVPPCEQEGAQPQEALLAAAAAGAGTDSLLPPPGDRADGRRPENDAYLNSQANLDPGPSGDPDSTHILNSEPGQAAVWHGEVLVLALGSPLTAAPQPQSEAPGTPRDDAAHDGDVSDGGSSDGGGAGSGGGDAPSKGSMHPFRKLRARGSKPEPRGGGAGSSGSGVLEGAAALRSWLRHSGSGASQATRSQPPAVSPATLSPAAGAGSTQRAEGALPPPAQTPAVQAAEGAAVLTPLPPLPPQPPSAAGPQGASGQLSSVVGSPATPADASRACSHDTGTAGGSGAAPSSSEDCSGIRDVQGEVTRGSASLGAGEAAPGGVAVEACDPSAAADRAPGGVREPILAAAGGAAAVEADAEAAAVVAVAAVEAATATADADVHGPSSAALAAAQDAIVRFGLECPQEVLRAAIASAILDEQMDRVTEPPPHPPPPPKQHSAQADRLAAGLLPEAAAVGAGGRGDGGSGAAEARGSCSSADELAGGAEAACLREDLSPVGGRPGERGSDAVAAASPKLGSDLPSAPGALTTGSVAASAADVAGADAGAGAAGKTASPLLAPLEAAGAAGVFSCKRVSTIDAQEPAASLEGAPAGAPLAAPLSPSAPSQPEQQQQPPPPPQQQQHPGPGTFAGAHSWAATAAMGAPAFLRTDSRRLGEMSSASHSPCSSDEEDRPSGADDDEAGAGAAGAGGARQRRARSRVGPLGRDLLDSDDPDEEGYGGRGYGGASPLQEYGSVYESATHDDMDEHGDDEEGLPLGRSNTIIRHLAGVMERHRMRASASAVAAAAAAAAAAVGGGGSGRVGGAAASPAHAQRAQAPPPAASSGSAVRPLLGRRVQLPPPALAAAAPRTGGGGPSQQGHRGVPGAAGADPAGRVEANGVAGQAQGGRQVPQAAGQRPGERTGVAEFGAAGEAAHGTLLRTVGASSGEVPGRGPKAQLAEGERDAAAKNGDSRWGMGSDGEQGGTHGARGVGASDTAAAVAMVVQGVVGAGAGVGAGGVEQEPGPGRAVKLKTPFAAVSSAAQGCSGL